MSREESHQEARWTPDTPRPPTTQSRKADQQGGADRGSVNGSSSPWPWAAHTISVSLSFLLFKRRVIRLLLGR